MKGEYVGASRGRERDKDCGFIGHPENAVAAKTYASHTNSTQRVASSGNRGSGAVQQPYEAVVCMVYCEYCRF